MRCCSSFLRKGGRVQVASCNLFVCGGMSRTAAPFSHNCTFCDSQQKWSVRLQLLDTFCIDRHVHVTFSRGLFSNCSSPLEFALSSFLVVH